MICAWDVEQVSSADTPTARDFYARGINLFSVRMRITATHNIITTSSTLFVSGAFSSLLGDWE